MFEKVPDILTVKECQQLLKIGKNSMLNFLHTGEIEGFKIGNHWRIYKESVIDFIRRR
jgi:excisionase family DNA binding protein